MAIGEYRVGETMSDEDSLAHYGVKGMKWGVRNAVLKGMDRSGFTSLAVSNAANSKKRTAVGVAVGRTVGGGARAQRKKSNLPASVRMNPGARVGMKVGQAYVKRQTTPDASGVTRRQAKMEIRSQNKELNRKIEDFDSPSNRDRSNQIREARKTNKAAMRKYEDIRDEVKAGKGAGVIGKNQAKIIMNKARNERYESIFKSDSKTAGEQFMDTLLYGTPVRR